MVARAVPEEVLVHPRHAVALDQAISPDRLGTYLRAGGGDPGRARALYLWDRDVASAVLADVAVVEVALRNALNDVLVRMYGEPQQWHVRYDDLWRAGLARAFPGGRTEAAALEARFSRAWTHQQVRTVQILRNRAAHHEPLINGVPLPGQRQSGRSRISVLQGHQACLLVLRMIDRDLGE